MRTRSEIFASAWQRIAILVLASASITAWRMPFHDNASKIAGTLPITISEMRGSDLKTLVATLSWTGGHDVARRCSGTVACDGGNASTSVRIDAAADARLTGGAATGKNGVIIARVRNNGATTEAMYGFKPGPYEYYLVVFGPEGKTHGRWELEEVRTDASFTHSTIASGPFTGCGHPAASFSSANFQTCDHTQVATPTALAPNHDAPGWVSCIDGCCEWVPEKDKASN